ncbi:hypothetical protein O7634_24655 [Micromonospora sp. WMMD1120]|uniref:hypothetical protein n=1 Tax=Micromonospora sp. WMMD1120 TaxID=3016106 RepID=UPI002415F2CA|nr:hypothetical protein [Micromonospora sp. WMMD1120]MDG4809955.1 hypothetical protein [Micromonospora sp. WMMD1120]
MSRAERWWRPAGQRPGARPPVRSARRARYAAQEKLMEGFDLGMKVGEAEERRRHQQRDEQIARLARAAEAAQDGDPSLLEEMIREQSGDDLLDVAKAAGATPLADVDGGQLVDEVEAWLRGDAQ